jgi:hypothetical protein|tara:strand:+ start:2014 stop:2154 length:141 start_codon:yes stop_codon:yes gene_type:complete
MATIAIILTILAALGWCIFITSFLIWNWINKREMREWNRNIDEDEC